MSAAALRVAVVGVGHLGSIHARIYAQSPAADLRFIIDVDVERASALAEELGCEALSDISDLPGDVEAVSVVVPTCDHSRIAVPLLERGMSCLVEKPLAANTAEADLILGAAERGGALLAVGHVERFQPGVRRLSGMEFKPRFIECHRLTQFSFRAMDVGVVHDLMIHDLDLVLHLVGSKVDSLDAAGGRILTEHEDVASVRLVFENGVRANVTANRVALKPMRRLRLFSAEGYASLDFAENEGLVIRRGGGWDAGISDLRTLDPRELAGREGFVMNELLDLEQLDLGGAERPLQAELASFLQSVRSGTTPEVSGEDGRAALSLADRITAEIRSQAW